MNEEIAENTKLAEELANQEIKKFLKGAQDHLASRANLFHQVDMSKFTANCMASNEVAKFLKLFNEMGITKILKSLHELQNR